MARKKTTPTFWGYRRPEGPPGGRNHLAIVSGMDNSNPIVRRIGGLVRDATPVNTSFGRALMGEDEAQHWRVMDTPPPTRTLGPPSS